MTWTCERCGKVFTSEMDYDRHKGRCGLGYKPKKCYHCNGTGYDFWRRKCVYCGGSGVLP
ncbi:hypothetical protein IJQ51_01050 [Candidatus Saccharibacteria bacterium]|nr:hypothetical protein [Candidatus Saccharibacteria bacterium]